MFLPVNVMFPGATPQHAGATDCPRVYRQLGHDFPPAPHGNSGEPLTIF